MIITLSPVDLILKLASVCVGAGEHPPNTNSGPFVELCQKETGNAPPDAWCASWVTRVGREALGDQWPVKRSGRVQHVSDWARDQKCRYLPAHGAAAGDLFVVWYASFGRHAHIGFVESVNADGSFTSLEGNTTMPGDQDPETMREGWCVARKKNRKLGSKDRLIRWTEELV